MSDVEKYGLFALAFVVAILGLIFMYGGDGESVSAAAANQPVVIRGPQQVAMQGARSSGNAPRRQAGGGRAQLAADEGNPPVQTFRVRSLVEGRGEFDIREPPVPYPGERSVAPHLAGEGQVLHTIRKGETLSDISKIHFGTTTRWRSILALNPGLDPEKLKPGDALVVQAGLAAEQPVAAADARPALKRPRTYMVKKGDTLGAIAQREMGSSKRSDELYQANRDQLPSPHKLKPGMRLRIP